MTGGTQAALDLGLASGFRLGPFSVAPRHLRIDGPSGSEQLQPRVMSVLVALAGRSGDVVTRDELIATVWGGRVVTDDALNRCVAKLRAVLGGGGATDPIVTIPRVGYRLMLPVTAHPADAVGPVEPTATAVMATRSQGFPSFRSSPRVTWIAGAVLAVGSLLAAGTAVRFVATRSPELPRAGPSVSATPPPGTLAVLPLENLTGDLRDEYLSDGLADEVRDQLASLPGVRVTARNSAYSFKHQRLRPDEVGRQLGVGRVLKGSMRREGVLLRVSLQLVDTRSGLATWAQVFERSPERVSDLQRDIAESVSAQLRLEIRPVTGSDRAPSATAYRLYLLGRYAFERRRDAAGIEDAIRLFQESVRTDAEFGSAHAMLAASLAILPAYRESVDRIASCEQAESSARRALAAAAMNGLAYAVIGYCEIATDRVVAERNLQHGLSLSPQLVEAHLWYGQLLLGTGRIKAALEEGERAAVLDPLSGPVYAFLAEAHYLNGEFEKAMALAGRSQSLGVADAGQILSKVALAQLKVEESARLWSASDGIDVGVARLVSAGLIDVATLPAARAPLESEIDRIPWPARGWSRLNMRLLVGDLAGALSALDEMELRVGRRRALQGFTGEDLWDPLSQVRSAYRDARFQKLLARTGLLNYYRATGTLPDLCQWAGDALMCTPRNWRATH
jgi:TolB-like protein/DNA-binding winged helix-turn-helix (wHTH) protein